MAIPNTLSLYIFPTLHLTTHEFSQISYYFFIFSAIFFIPVGILFELIDIRKLMLISFTALIASMILLACSHSLFWILTARSISGICYCFAFIGNIRIAKDWYAKQPAFIIGLTTMIGLTGTLAAQAPASILAHCIGWRYMLLVFACLGIIAWLFLYNILKDNHISNFSKINFKNWLKNIFVFKHIWLCSIYACLLNTPMLILGDQWGNLYLKQVFYVDDIHASFLITILFLGLMLGCPLIGFLSDKFQSRRFIMSISPLLTLLMFLPIYLHYLQHYIFLLITFFGIGLIASSQALIYTHLLKNFPNDKGKVIGIVTSIVMVINAVTQWLFNQLISLRGSSIIDLNINDYDLAISIIPLALIFSFFVAILIRDSHISLKS